MKKAPFSPFRTIPLFFKNFWNGLQVFADRKIPAILPCFKGEMGTGEKCRWTGAENSTHDEGRHKRSGFKARFRWWSHSIREIAVSNFRVVQVFDLLRVWGA